MSDNGSAWMIAPSKFVILEKENQKILTSDDIWLMETRLRESHTCYYRTKLKPLSFWDKCKAIFKRKLKSK